MFQHNFEYFIPSRILFGQGQLSQVGNQASRLGKKALLVTGRTSMSKAGITDQVRNYLKERKVGVVLFDKVEPNPSAETANKGAQLAKKENCDIIIGLGGGSTIDAAKAIAVIVSHGGNAKDYFRPREVPGPILPVVAIPSTAGTGSEVTRYAVLTDKTTNRKEAIQSEFIIPKISLVDPKIMVSQSSYLTSSTGMDALTHAIEAYTSLMSNPISDVYATKAIQLIAAYLRRAVWMRDDMEARSAMALASTLAGMAICWAGAGAAHALGMTVGGFFETPHGATVGILLPHVVECNLPAQLEKYTHIACLMGQSIKGLSKREAALASTQAVQELILDLDTPKDLIGLGAIKEKAKEVAEDAATQGAMKNNSRKLTLEEIENLYLKACGQ